MMHELLESEINMLKAALVRIQQKMDNNEEDFVKMAGLMARFTDSVRRLRLAQQKLHADGTAPLYARRQIEIALRSIGLGERELPNE